MRSIVVVSWNDEDILVTADFYLDSDGSGRSWWSVELISVDGDVNVSADQADRDFIDACLKAYFEKEDNAQIY